MPFFLSSRSTSRRIRGRRGGRFACAQRSWVTMLLCWASFPSLNRRSPLYDRFPTIPSGLREECIEGWPAIAGAIGSRMGARSVIVVECYPGTFLQEIHRELSLALGNAAFVSTPGLFRPAAAVDAMLEPLLGDDPVFGMMNSMGIEEFFDPARLAGARARCLDPHEPIV